MLRVGCNEKSLKSCSCFRLRPRPGLERASLASPTLSSVHDRALATADKLCSNVVACRKGVSTQLEASSRDCTRLAGLKVLAKPVLPGCARDN